MYDLARLINRLWRRSMGPLVKYTAIFMAVSAGGFIFTQSVLIPTLTKGSNDPRTTVVRKNTGGKSFTTFGDERTPKTFDAEMQVSAPQLILQNQERFYRSEDGGGNEDIATGPTVQLAERARLHRTTIRFLRAWETYRVGDRPAAYRSRLADIVIPSSLDDVSSRIDNRQPAAVGIDGVTGSAAYRPEIYGRNLRIFRYDGRTAYGAITAPVSYTGPARQWSGRSFNRSYGIVFQRFGAEWRVARVAAQTLGEVQHFTPDSPPDPAS